jgi:hypothetical protein
MPDCRQFPAIIAKSKKFTKLSPDKSGHQQGLVKDLAGKAMDAAI